MENKRPHITLCMIVKNEAQHLSECLENARPHVDQMVVADTGSTDNTLRIARAAGAETYSVTWTNDFAAARNSALKYAKGDWILQLDADHQLKVAGSFDLHQFLQETRHTGFLFPEESIVEGEKAVSVDRLLLFKNFPGLKYQGRIHENPLISLQKHAWKTGIEQPIARLEKMKAIHHGYHDPLAKLKRNLPILRQALHEAPGNPHYQYKLLLTLKNTGETEEFVRYLNRFFEQFVAERPAILTASHVGILGLKADRLVTGQADPVERQKFLDVVTPVGDMTGWNDVRLAMPVARLFSLSGMESEACSALVRCIENGIAAPTAPVTPDDRIAPVLFLIRLYLKTNANDKLRDFMIRTPALLKVNGLNAGTVFNKLLSRDPQSFNKVLEIMKSVQEVES